MNKINLSHSSFFIAALVHGAMILGTASVAMATSPQGQERGNAGDEYSKEFISIGKEVWVSLKKSPIMGVDLNRLAHAISSTHVSSQDQLVLRGKTVDAINYPESNPPSIVVSRSGWDRMSERHHDRAFLVLHEYLSIMKVNDSTYQISSQLDRAGVCARNSAVRAELEIKIKKYCFDITPADLHFSPIELRPTMAEGAPGEALSRKDLKGLDRVVKFYFDGAPSIITKDVFADTPAIEAVSISAPQVLEQFQPQKTLMSLNLTPGYVIKMAANAFSNLSALQQLQVGVDIEAVNLVQAIGRVPNSLTELIVWMKHPPTDPGQLVTIMQNNPQLNYIEAIIEGGDLTPVFTSMSAAGFFCKYASESTGTREAICFRHQ